MAQFAGIVSERQSVRRLGRARISTEGTASGGSGYGTNVSDRSPLAPDRTLAWNNPGSLPLRCAKDVSYIIWKGERYVRHSPLERG